MYECAIAQTSPTVEIELYFFSYFIALGPVSVDRELILSIPSNGELRSTARLIIAHARITISLDQLL